MFYTNLTFQRSFRGRIYSPNTLLWLQSGYFFFEANKNCSQEFVESSFRVLVFYCYSNNYVELCSWDTEVESMDVWLQFPFRLATISLFLATIKKTSMKTNFRTAFYLRSNYVNKEGKTPVMLRIYLNNERISLGSTGIAVEQSQKVGYQTIRAYIYSY